MYNSRLIKHLKKLSPSEVKRFIAFVEAPYFGFQDKLVRLGTYLGSMYPDFSGEMMSKKKIGEFLFGRGKVVSDQAIHDQFSQLNKCFDQFLAQSQYEKDESQQQLYITRAYATRRERDQLQRQWQKVDKKLNSKQGLEPRHHFFRFQNLQEVNSLQQQRKLKKEADPLAQMGQEMDFFYLSSRLKLACELQNRQRIFNISYEQELIHHLLAFLQGEDNTYLENPLISIYVSIFNLLSQPSDEAYQATKSKIQVHQAILSINEKRNMYAFLQNHCIKQINAGKSAYLNELFELFNILLEQQILINRDGYISHAYIKNIVTVGLRLQKYVWVKSFLDKYKGKIHPQHREDAYHYNLAQYYYEQKQYRQALQLLVQIAFTDLFYQLDSRALQMRVYYEMGEDDSLSYLVKAFKTFLKRNEELSKSQYVPYENLLKLSQQAYRLKMRKGFLSKEKFQEKLKKLNGNIEKSQAIANLQWLRRKVAELEQEN